MNKIYWICALASFMFSICAGAQASKNVHATLNEATLYLNGAEMIHSATASLTKGEQEIIIEGLSSSSVDKNSMKITASNGVIISAYEYSTNYLTEKVLSSTAQKLQDSINIYRKKISALETDMSINKRLGELLKSGTDKTVSGSDKGLSFDELVKMMDYYKSKYKELAISADEYREKLKEYNESIRRLESQFNLEAVKNNRTSGIIKLTVNAPVAVNCHFTLSYYTTSASWAPYYDVNVESVERPVKFVMKAKARQTTGIDWEKIKLTLSTANPGNGKIAPLFSTWFLGFNETRAYQAQRSMVQNSYAYDLAEVRSADIVAPLAKSVEEKEIADDAGAVSPVYIYMINGEISDEATYNSLEPSSIKARDFYNAAQANEKYGVVASGVWNVELKGSLDDYVKVGDNELNISYAIDLPYSIPGNGKEQTIELKNQEASATYKYYSVPKLSGETYMLAEIANPERLNLLSGKANITYEGSYIGESLIDANSTRANLTLTLGTDKRISVKREKMQNFSSKKSLGSEIEQIQTYKITVRNGQNRSIKMTLKDQYPVSTQKEIKVELLKETTKPSFHVEETGVLSWEEELTPGESKTYIISFSVKYPKNKTVNL